MKSYIIVGGAGFIGSHFADKLLSDKTTQKVTIYDNFSSGRKWHYKHHLIDGIFFSPRFNVITGDVEDTSILTNAMQKHDVVIHLASNPDIAKASTQPSIDFWQGTALTSSVLEAMRQSGVNRLLYASGSGIYGDLGKWENYEDEVSLRPTSTYGASKLAGETLIHSYCCMFGLSACCFRFGNVVGARQTHGVGLDFTKRLLVDPTKLYILGDGNQSKSYIHVSDVVNAVLMANEKLTGKYSVYNVATGDYITVNEIAKIAAQCIGIPEESIKLEYSGGDRGWKGDVPIIRLNTDRIKSLGWRCSMSTSDAIKKSIMEMLPDIKSNKM
ncbi:WcaG Nucleoside-diphosphate-sugar epimerases [uncultured Caudovirales phage]|uniref:WcaG Nucleoside-diphosphate-sugar epimerases n=1 Tax=uncultured Caudovirales phage TaxID=2100421 RepID=A0A6J5RY43_9CAUD|nr:WcaG Nucleoside-diphosphate-sugar epimerases [uncultured Caudovirales phage]